MRRIDVQRKRYTIVACEAVDPEANIGSEAKKIAALCAIPHAVLTLFPSVDLLPSR